MVWAADREGSRAFEWLKSTQALWPPTPVGHDVTAMACLPPSSVWTGARDGCIVKWAAVGGEPHAVPTGATPPAGSTPTSPPVSLHPSLMLCGHSAPVRLVSELPAAAGMHSDVISIAEDGSACMWDTGRGSRCLSRRQLPLVPGRASALLAGGGGRELCLAVDTLLPGWEDAVPPAQAELLSVFAGTALALLDAGPHRGGSGGPRLTRLLVPVYSQPLSRWLQQPQQPAQQQQQQDEGSREEHVLALRPHLVSGTAIVHGVTSRGNLLTWVLDAANIQSQRTNRLMTAPTFKRGSAGSAAAPGPLLRGRLVDASFSSDASLLLLVSQSGWLVLRSVDAGEKLQPSYEQAMVVGPPGLAATLDWDWQLHSLRPHPHNHHGHAAGAGGTAAEGGAGGRPLVEGTIPGSFIISPPSSPPLAADPLLQQHPSGRQAQQLPAVAAAGAVAATGEGKGQGPGGSQRHVTFGPPSDLEEAQGSGAAAANGTFVAAAGGGCPVDVAEGPGRLLIDPDSEYVGGMVLGGAAAGCAALLLVWNARGEAALLKVGLDGACCLVQLMAGLPLRSGLKQLPGVATLAGARGGDNGLRGILRKDSSFPSPATPGAACSPGKGGVQASVSPTPGPFVAFVPWGGDTTRLLRIGSFAGWPCGQPHAACCHTFSLAAAAAAPAPSGDAAQDAALCVGNPAGASPSSALATPDTCSWLSDAWAPAGAAAGSAGVDAASVAVAGTSAGQQEGGQLGNAAAAAVSVVAGGDVAPRFLVQGTSDGWLQVWSLAGYSSLATGGSSECGGWAGLSQQGETASPQDWLAATGPLLHRVRAHNGAVRCMVEARYWPRPSRCSGSSSFTSSGGGSCSGDWEPALVTGGADGAVKCWQLQGSGLGECLLDLHAHTGEVERLLLPPPGSPAPWCNCVASVGAEGSAAVSSLSDRSLVLMMPGHPAGTPEALLWDLARGYVGAWCSTGGGGSGAAPGPAALLGLGPPPPPAPTEAAAGQPAQPPLPQQQQQPGKGSHADNGGGAPSTQQQQQRRRSPGREPMLAVWDVYSGAKERVLEGPSLEAALPFFTQSCASYRPADTLITCEASSSSSSSSPSSSCVPPFPATRPGGGAPGQWQHGRSGVATAAGGGKLGAPASSTWLPAAAAGGAAAAASPPVSVVLLVLDMDGLLHSERQQASEAADMKGAAMPRHDAAISGRNSLAAAVEEDVCALALGISLMHWWGLEDEVDHQLQALLCELQLMPRESLLAMHGAHRRRQHHHGPSSSSSSPRGGSSSTHDAGAASPGLVQGVLRGSGGALTLQLPWVMQGGSTATGHHLQAAAAAAGGARGSAASTSVPQTGAPHQNNHHAWAVGGELWRDSRAFVTRQLLGVMSLAKRLMSRGPPCEAVYNACSSLVTFYALRFRELVPWMAHPDLERYAHLWQASTDSLKDAARALLAAGTDPAALGGRFPPEVAAVMSLRRGPGGQIPREALQRHALQVLIAGAACVFHHRRAPDALMAATVPAVLALACACPAPSSSAAAAILAEGLLGSGGPKWRLCLGDLAAIMQRILQIAEKLAVLAAAQRQQQQQQPSSSQPVGSRAAAGAPGGQPRAGAAASHTRTYWSSANPLSVTGPPVVPLVLDYGQQQAGGRGGGGGGQQQQAGGPASHRGAGQQQQQQQLPSSSSSSPRMGSRDGVSGDFSGRRTTSFDRQSSGGSSSGRPSLDGSGGSGSGPFGFGPSSASAAAGAAASGHHPGGGAAASMTDLQECRDAVSAVVTALAAADLPIFLHLLGSRLAGGGGVAPESPTHLTCFTALIRLLHVHQGPQLVARQLPLLAAVVTRGLDPTQLTLRRSCVPGVMAVVRELCGTFPCVALHQTTMQLAVGRAAPPGRWQDTGQDDTSVQEVFSIYDLDSGAKRWVLLPQSEQATEIDAGLAECVSAAAFSPAGDLLAAYSAADRCLRVWWLVKNWSSRFARGPALLAPRSVLKLDSPARGLVTPEAAAAVAAASPTGGGGGAGGGGVGSGGPVDLSYRLRWEASTSVLLLSRHGRPLAQVAWPIR